MRCRAGFCAGKATNRRGKDEVINVAQRASLYQTIARLEREGLIAGKVTRDENRPERTARSN